MIEETPPYWITRALFLRGLGVIYLFAYLALALQGKALWGVHGLLPMEGYRDDLAAMGIGFRQNPSLFWFFLGDDLILNLAWAGVALSVTVIMGWATSISLLALWGVYLSYVNFGQIFLGYGWETLLLEVGFLAVFMAPMIRPGEFARNNPPSRLLIFLLLWVLFRLMFGAGMIKIHGDSCWRDLTCLDFHFETQPLPNPLSWFFHNLPPSVLHFGVGVNHFVELVSPWMLLFGRRMRRWAGVFIILFQATLILSGNLSWLNYLTIVIAIACFDDHSLWLLIPKRLKQRLLSNEQTEHSKFRSACIYGYTGLVLVLSFSPAVNLFATKQKMNASFDPIHLVNTYGAFGTVGRERYEIILQGTDAEVPDDRAQWKEYEFPCKPGSVSRMPCVVAPYQPRLDWQIWFAAMSRIEREPWLVNFVYKLLNGDEDAASLLDSNPFPNAPPKYIRAQYYQYHLADPRNGQWWTREYMSPYFAPLSKNSPELRRFLTEAGFLPESE